MNLYIISIDEVLSKIFSSGFSVVEKIISIIPGAENLIVTFFAILITFILIIIFIYFLPFLLPILKIFFFKKKKKIKKKKKNINENQNILFN